MLFHYPVVNVIFNMFKRCCIAWVYRYALCFYIDDNLHDENELIYLYVFEENVHYILYLKFTVTRE